MSAACIPSSAVHLGNFSYDQASRFLRDVRNTANDNDWFLLGVDMVKDHRILNAAYNDSNGYTAAFNLNVLKCPEPGP